MIRVAVAGAAGKMGATVCEAVEGAEGLRLSGRADPALGVELGEILDEADVVVDFTVPDTALANVRSCLEAGVHAVVGTTGFELHHDRKLDAPSGTAKRTAELIEAAGGNVHEPIHSVRLPGLVAHQEVVFGGVGQTLSLRHDSIDRRSFMPGVVLAVRRVGELPDRFTVGLEKLLLNGR